MVGDYTEARLAFKLRKAARYVRLFGVRRTWAKIAAQYHMKAATGFKEVRWANPRCQDREHPRRNVAIIGCGLFAFSNIAYYCAKWNSHFLRYAYDTERSRALSLCKAYGGAFAIADWREILQDPSVTLVFIASNHASHAEYAIACIEAGKHVHIEKPHVVSRDQLARLTQAMRNHPVSKVFLGFNRPRSPLFKRLRTMLADQSGALMINWFVAGHEIPEGHWYFDDKEGGRILGNLCHWTDLTLQLVTVENAFPCTIVPATPQGSKSDFVVSIIFADQSCASITFSAKGHAFEGVREVLNVHKGNLIANLTDFKVMSADIVEKKVRISLPHRDHGHKATVFHSLARAAEPGTGGEHPEYVTATAQLFLGIREAVEGGVVVKIPGV
jgi:predicted dehydrogenase